MLPKQRQRIDTLLHAIFEQKWSPTGLPGELLASLGGLLGGFWEARGRLLGSLGSVLGPSWLPRAPKRRFLLNLGAKIDPRGPKMDPPGSQNGPPGDPKNKKTHNKKNHKKQPNKTKKQQKKQKKTKTKTNHSEPTRQLNTQSSKFQAER